MPTNPRQADGPGPAALSDRDRRYRNSQTGPRPRSYGDERRSPFSPTIAGQTADQPPSRLPPGLDVDTDMTYATDAELENYIRQNYGYMAAFLDNGEVRKVLFDAARGDWDEARMYGAMSATSWWRNTSASQRTWQRLLSEDPAEAQRMVNTTAANVTNRVKSLGISLSPSQIAKLSADATANGWSQDEVIDQLVSRISWDNVAGGDLTATVDSINEIASNYLVGIDKGTAQNYAARIASGELSLQGVQSILSNQAKARFGYMADAIDGGATVKDYFDPVKNVIARELEVTPDEVNLMSPEWLSVVEQRDEKGNLRAATLHEAQLAARRRPEWARTKGAQSSGTSLVNMVADVFGRSSI